MPVSEFPDSISDLGPRFVLVRSSRPGGRLVLLFRRASGFPRMTPEFDRGWPRIVFPVAESALRAHRFASLCVRPPKSVLFSTTWREAVTVPVSVRSAVGLRMVGGNFDRRIARAEPAEPEQELSFRGDELTNSEAVATLIERINADPSLSDEQRERLSKPLNSALKFWKQRKQDAEKSAIYEQTLSTIGGDTSSARRQVEQKTPDTPEILDLRYKSLERLLEGRAAQDA